MGIELRPPADKALRRLSRTDRERIYAAIQRLPAGDVKPVIRSGGQYRLRVGPWRVLFESGPDSIIVHMVAPRGSAYRQ